MEFPAGSRYINPENGKRNHMAEKSKRVTLARVASACGVSVTAVSSILNNDPKYRVSEATRELVLRKVKELKYIPNSAARSLITRQNRTVGLLFYSIKDRCYSDIMELVQYELAKHGYASVFAFWNGSSLAKSFDLLLRRGVDGIITNAPESFLRDLVFDIPLVLYGCGSTTHDAVVVDRATPLPEIMDYLRQNGHRRFGYICNRENEPRYEVFADYLGRHKLELRSEWAVRTRNCNLERAEAMRSILSCKERPTAMILQNDISAMICMSLASEAGLRIPEEMSFVGFDNLFESRYSIPPLTTLDIRQEETAMKLVEILMKRLAQPELPPMREHITPYLVMRQSCAPTPEFLAEKSAKRIFESRFQANTVGAEPR